MQDRSVIASVAPVALVCFLFTAPVRAQEPLEEPPKIEAAGPAQLDLLMKKQEAALVAKDGAELMRVLDEMVSFNNPELAVVAREALSYKLTKVDKAAVEAQAEELGMRKKKEKKLLLFEREGAVQAAAARLLANFPGDKKASSALVKAFKDKRLRKDKPKALGAVILSLAQVGNRKVEPDVYKLFKAFEHEDIMRASVRYFGTIKTNDYSIVRALCEQLAAPEPGAVDSPSNPPGSYWASRWEKWSKIRRDVAWSLKELTGQVFRPAEGEHPGDSAKALSYIKDNKRKLGLK
ncbi:MAG: hypothetical protein GY711_34265 [bacterium]|nr:hypothetical protein [bacterium]